MTEGCRLIKNFAENIAQPCKMHGIKPRVNFEGIWVIECEKGCSRHTVQEKPHDLISLYIATPF